MNNDNYKKAIDQIHASENLKEKTLNKVKQNKVKKVSYMKYLAACAMFLVVILLGANYIEKENELENNEVQVPLVSTKYQIAKEKNDLPRFKNIDQLKKVLKDNNLTTNGIRDLEVLEDSITSTTASASEETKKEYSTTNVQVENVDEADIVKTDGDYIYYVLNEKVYIIKADTLEILSVTNEISETDIEYFSPIEIFINNNKLIVLGNCSTRYQSTMKTDINETIMTDEITTENSVTKDVGTVTSKNTAKAIVYNISDRKNPVITREVELDGNYSNSRMIGDNIYFISTKGAYLYDGIEDYEILPICKDTVISDDIKRIDCTDIVYFEGTESYSYTLVAGFNINNNEEMFLETFFGASDTIYASEENLYLAQIKYDNDWRETSNTIYKFNLEDSKVILQCEANVKGDLKNQFSLDEYNGNLRLATTSYSGDETSNNLYILDENLKEIGKIENLAPGERIYSVRFIGKIGYVVTFKEVDPLFVIDLSDPTNPTVKGELKIPGYSSYLHPYDETHIIGIGYNTRDNGYGGITNAGLKMSMFDVSDLENPKEMFSTNIGGYYAYSEINYNHKVLFYNKSENLIGFPINYTDEFRGKSTNSFIIFKIDLENGFEKYGEIIRNTENYSTTIRRVIYIDDILYALSYKNVVAYDLNTLEKIKEVELDTNM